MYTKMHRSKMYSLMSFLKLYLEIISDLQEKLQNSPKEFLYLLPPNSLNVSVLIILALSCLFRIYT